MDVLSFVNDSFVAKKANKEQEIMVCSVFPSSKEMSFYKMLQNKMCYLCYHSMYFSLKWSQH